MSQKYKVKYIILHVKILLKHLLINHAVLIHKLRQSMKSKKAVHTLATFKHLSYRIGSKLSLAANTYW